jgi:hypothetical protein
MSLAGIPAISSLMCHYYNDALYEDRRVSSKVFIVKAHVVDEKFFDTGGFKVRSSVSALVASINTVLASSALHV